MASSTNNWLYRATEEEHKLILEAVRMGNFPSVASFVREACLRLACSSDLSQRFSDLEDSVQAVKDLVKKYEREEAL